VRLLSFHPLLYRNGTQRDAAEPLQGGSGSRRCRARGRAGAAPDRGGSKGATPRSAPDRGAVGRVARHRRAGVLSSTRRPGGGDAVVADRGAGGGWRWRSPRSWWPRRYRGSKSSGCSPKGGGGGDLDTADDDFPASLRDRFQREYRRATYTHFIELC
jgi:hypothetical protein